MALEYRGVTGVYREIHHLSRIFDHVEELLPIGSPFIGHVLESLGSYHPSAKTICPAQPGFAGDVLTF